MTLISLFDDQGDCLPTPTIFMKQNDGFMSTFEDHLDDTKKKKLSSMEFNEFILWLEKIIDENNKHNYTIELDNINSYFNIQSKDFNEQLNTIKRAKLSLLSKSIVKENRTNKIEKSRGCLGLLIFSLIIILNFII